MELLRRDSLGSLLAFLKMRLHIEFFLPHNRVYVYQYVRDLFLLEPIVYRYEDGTQLILENQKVRLGIKEDWTFPVDPWKREDK